jgi:hypothetical protein
VERFIGTKPLDIAGIGQTLQFLFGDTEYMENIGDVLRNAKFQKLLERIV